MSHSKIVHLILVIYIQQNFTSTSKTVHIYVFCLFVSEIVVKIYHVFILGKYVRNFVRVRPICFGWLCKTEWNMAYKVTFLQKDDDY